MRQVLGPGALGRPRGIGWKGRWEEGSWWGIHVNPWLIHVYVWQNPLQYCKVISLQLIKKNVRSIKLKKRNILKIMLKFFKLGFNSMWIENFQMFRLDLEKAEESEIKLPTSSGSQKKQENSRKTSTSVSVTRLKSFTVWITTNWNILKEMGLPDHLIWLLRNLYADQETTELDIEQQTGSKLGKDYVRAIYSHPAYLNSMQSTSWKILG